MLDKKTIIGILSKFKEEGFNPDLEIELAIISDINNTRKPDNFDGLHCIECGDEIPIGRLKLNKCNCISCQEIQEKSSKHFYKPKYYELVDLQ